MRAQPVALTSPATMALRHLSAPAEVSWTTTVSPYWSAMTPGRPSDSAWIRRKPCWPRNSGSA
jgi:hypothetical protein